MPEAALVVRVPCCFDAPKETRGRDGGGGEEMIALLSWAEERRR